jgi:hypothetical protein
MHTFPSADFGPLPTPESEGFSALPSPLSPCRGCGKQLRFEDYRIADGCPCNSARGVNHGIVPVATCTCEKCDPEHWGKLMGQWLP